MQTKQQGNLEDTKLYLPLRSFMHVRQCWKRRVSLETFQWMNGPSIYFRWMMTSSVWNFQSFFGTTICEENKCLNTLLYCKFSHFEIMEASEIFIAGDLRWVRTAGSALHLLQSIYGPFSKVYGIGRCSKMAYESWKEQAKEEEQNNQNSEIGNVFLLDRDVDLVTPMCSQVVYEGLVDDIFRIKCGCVEFGPDVSSSDNSIKVMLNSQDKVFNEIRNEHFSNVFSFLSQKARNLQVAYDKRRGMDIKQMKTFVSEELKGLKQEHRLLSLHISASESIMKKKTKQDFQELLKTEHSLLEGFEIRECISFIEVHINRQVSMTESLRLLCLLSLTENGLLPKEYRSLKTQFLQSYGVEHLLTFANLKQLGLFVEQQQGETLAVMENKVGKLVNDKTAGKLTDAFSSLARKNNFRALSRKLNLVPKSNDEYDLHLPKDMAYVFSGAYIPLSCKLIEQVLERDGWAGLEEVAKLLNGNEFAVSGKNRANNEAQRVIVVMFLGGCTFSEISALRFLGKERVSLVDAPSDTEAPFEEEKISQSSEVTGAILAYHIRPYLDDMRITSN
ncbi:vacuolar protein sorting-associated protein 33B isoform X6 [Syngnathoides biaculeatus]|uniref:vacuolar protein sorting-associated protein 33B isoform X6 n=1 Tax=Syngnathoides biaculeatus TaxID=300417 RepID=UPI002ADE36F4|nr:vacuolar protein sorting-associated protein 33B isoform X6 [Syngnathoides biaculeatus]XP_061671716.1 vacuolar protein sorting-associated protein 33B isoform X6 [Syngnathoides biaculeatus]XP_061671717.1 vacuolar protein sorting-associated protein 33B isoform X6 [Syngnathoides biaculeatus]